MAIHAQSSCTLSTITDVEAVYTYYYLSDSTITVNEAPKDNVNPPGASTITVISDEHSYVWQITEPQLDIEDDVIQTAVGKLYYIECVEFSDGTYDWGPLMTSSTYAAAKAAYNLSSQALSQAQAANDATALLGGHFIYNSTWETTNTPHSANVIQTIEKDHVDVTQDPTKWDYNVHIGSNGIRLRNNESVLSEWTSTALKFNNPSTGNTQLIIGANGALQSGNYSYSSGSIFSNTGTKIDLVDGTIYSPYFRILTSTMGSNEPGAYIRGDVVAHTGRFGSSSTNYWLIDTYTDMNQGESYSSLRGLGKSFIQLGSNNTWTLGTSRINSSWRYTSSDASGVTNPFLLRYKRFGTTTNDNYYDYGMNLPTILNTSDQNAKRIADKFLYIRTANYVPDNNLANLDLDSSWSYPFYVDSQGNVRATAFYIGDSTTSIGGGVGTIAEKLMTGAGSTTQPVYFPTTGENQGKPVAISYTIQSNVPENAVFTDHITTATTSGNGNAVTAITSDTNGNLTVTKGSTFLTQESDPTVPAWAKEATKPSYSYDEITGTVPQTALPSYVDDVLEYNGKSNFPTTGESGKIYVDTSTNKTYRWGGTTYVEISSSLALGETDSTAYRGDRGKIAYDHANAKGSAFTSGLYKITTNSEGHVTAAVAASKSDVGLGNVDNKSSATIRSEITSDNVTNALGFTPYDATNPSGYITSADVSDTKVNVSTRGSTKAYLLATTSSPTSTKTAREAVAETGVYLETNNSATRLIAPTFVGNLTGTASGNLTSNSNLAWSKVTGADDLKAIENLSGTSGLLRKTAANTWELDTTNYLSSFTESDPVFSASAASGITSSDITNWNNKTSNTGTVTSVRVQASSPVKSSTSSAQSSSLNTTISLEDAYGDLKNPYGSKTARYVLAAPAGANGVPSFRALTNADVGLSNVTNYSQITKIGDSGDGKLRVWTGDPDSTSSDDYTDVTVHITAYDQSTVAKAAALDLSADIGSTKKPVYFKSDGKPYAINYTIETSVPSGALFTDTTYTFTDGVNGFTVTPKGGTAQTVNVTPSIANNVTGSGTSGKLVKWNGTNTITDGPTLTSGGTGYLKEDGTWGTPGGTYSLPTAKYDTLGGLKPWYSTTGASTLASGSAGANTSTPSINARSSTAGKYYAVEIDKNGRLFVNVPWTNTNGSYLTSAVTTLTTQAGAHTVVSSASGDVTIKIPTATSHLTNDSGYITGYVDEKVKLTSKTDNVAYKVTLGPSSITSGTAYEGYYSTNLTYNPSAKELINGTIKLKSTSSTTANTSAYDTLTLGNNVAVSSTTAHSQGQLILYGSTTYAHTIQGAPTAARTITLPDKTGTVALTSDLSGFITDAGVTKITTTAGAHTAITNATGAVSFNVPTTAAHVGIKFGYTTSGNNRAVQQDSSGNLYVTQKDDNTNYYHTTGSWGGTNNLTYTATANGGAGALALTLATASTSVYGATKLTDTYTSTDSTLALTGKAVASAINGATNKYVTLDTNPTLTAAGTKTYLGLQTYGTDGLSLGITSSSSVTEKVNMKYDTTLDALVFSFI